jgi:hypothetical protein
MRAMTAGIAIILGAAGCGHPAYVYQPTALATATVDGQPASRYPVPPESPRGEVTVGSLGMTEMDRSGGAKGTFVHTRMVVSNNNGEGAWTVDPGRQLLALPRHTPIAPAYVNATDQVIPQGTVAPGQKLTMDLFFALPPDLKDAGAVPEFDLLWNVQMPGRELAERTTFERLQVVPAPEPMPAYAWAGRWWADPWWYGSIGPGPWWRDPLAPRFVVVRRPSRIVVRQPQVMARPAPAPGWRGNPPAQRR